MKAQSNLRGVAPWQAERTGRLHNICRSIEGRIRRGQSFHKAVTYFAWYWRGKFYHCEPTRAIRFSRKTLIRLFYQWRANGRSAKAFTLRYAVQPSRVDAGRLRLFLHACFMPGICSYAAAHHLTGDFTVSRDTYQKAIPTPLRRALTKLFYRERLALSACRKALAIWKGAIL